MQAKYITSIDSNHELLDEGNISLIKGKYGWKLAVVNPDGDIWRISTYIKYMWIIAGRSLAIKTYSGNIYTFDVVGMTPEEAIERFNKVVGLTW